MKNRNRKGNVVFTAVTMVGMTGFGSLAVDASMLRVSHSQAQNASDVAAHAAVSMIDFDDESTWD